MAKDASGGQPSSMLQGLQAILGSLGTLMAAPDADVNFLTTLQHAIVGKIKQSTAHAVQPNQVQPGGGPGGMAGFGGLAQQMGGQGGPGGPPPGGPPGGAGATGMGGAPGAGGMPNPDELRRVMGANGQTG